MDRLLQSIEDWNRTHPDAAYPLNAPATQQEIESLRERMQERYAYVLPQDYEAFLQIHDGLNFDGLSICGTAQVKSAEGFTLSDSLDALTEYVRNDLQEPDLICYGQGNESFLVFDTANGVFQYRDETISTLLDTCSTFEELVEHVAVQESCLT